VTFKAHVEDAKKLTEKLGKRMEGRAERMDVAA
jgi:hypothetical protein